MSNVQFLGEIPSSEFINGDQLASSIGLSVGTSQYNSEPWLHFMLDGKEVYVAKKPLRSGLSWEAINKVGAVYGSKTVTINDVQYRVRLIRGGNGDPTTTGGAYSGYNTTEHQGSEWNRLMYPVHSTSHTNTSNVNTIEMGTLAQYTDADLLVFHTAGNGTHSWCQEVSGTGADQRVLRGYHGVTYGGYTGSHDTNTNCGWRPVLERLSLNGITHGEPYVHGKNQQVINLTVEEIVKEITALTFRGVTGGVKVSVEGSNDGITYSIFVPN